MSSYKKNGIYYHNNRFIFGGVDLSNLVVVEKVQRTLLPTIINEGIFIDGKYGQSLKRTYVDNRIIQVNVRILESSKQEREEVVKQLATSLFSKEPKKLELNDSDLFNYAKVTSTSDLINEQSTRSIAIIFECFDPFNYGETKIELINEEFVNEGSKAVGRIVCITNNTNTILVKQRGKTLMTIQHNISAGNELIIDLRKQHITLNGTSIMKQLTLDSDFFTIDQGVNLIEVTGVNRGTVEYEERWL